MQQRVRVLYGGVMESPQAHARRNFRMQQNLVIHFLAFRFSSMRYDRMNISCWHVEFNIFRTIFDFNFLIRLAQVTLIHNK